MECGMAFLVKKNDGNQKKSKFKIQKSKFQVKIQE